LWREALAAHPDAPELLIGFGTDAVLERRTGTRRGVRRSGRAPLAPEDRTARQLERSLRMALRPDLVSSSDGGRDSDDNDFVALNGSYSVPLGPRVRATLHSGWRGRPNPARVGASYGADARAVVGLGRSTVWARRPRYPFTRTRTAGPEYRRSSPSSGSESGRRATPRSTSGTAALRLMRPRS